LRSFFEELTKTDKIAWIVSPMNHAMAVWAEDETSGLELGRIIPLGSRVLVLPLDLGLFFLP
jgi:hypothetical protein